MSSFPPKPSKAQWLEYRTLIGSFYLSDNMSLKELVEKLKQHGLHVTENQLEYKLKRWKIHKNMHKETWEYVYHHITKRKREGKDSEVIHCGKRVESRTLDKETGRFCKKTVFAELGFQEGSPPLTPVNTPVVVHTPPPLLPSSSTIVWPSTLPWLQFLAKQQRTISTLIAGTSRTRVIGRGSLISTVLSQRYGLCMEKSHIMVFGLARLLRTSMPESYPQEAFLRAQCLLNGPEEEFLHEGLLLAVFNISNNNVDRDDHMEWEAIIAILKHCRLLDLKKRDLEGLRSGTVDAFLGNMFGAIISMMLNDDQIDEDEILMMIKWLLALGQDPDAVLDPDGAGTALRAAIMCGSLRIARCLLDAGADVNFIPPSVYNIYGLRGPDEKPYSCLDLALRRDYDDPTMLPMVDLLLEYAASTESTLTLYQAIEVNHKNLIERIVEQGADLCSTTEARHDRYFLHEETALSVAAGVSLSATKFVWGLLKSKDSFKAMTNKFVTADVLISAAASGNDDVLRFLQPFSDGAFANCYGNTPLHVAARHGHLTTCQLLLPSYKEHISNASIIFSPLQLASYGGHDLVVQFLIANGENVNAAPKYFDCRSPPDIAKRYFSQRSSRFVVFENLRLFTPLDFALRGGHLTSCTSSAMSCAVMLINAGAKLHGYEIGVAAFKLHIGLLLAVLVTGANPSGALQYALECRTYCPQQLCDIVDLLLQYGATLHGGVVASAIQHKNWDLMTLLLRYGGSLHDTGSDGMPILEALIAADWTRVLERVVSAKPDLYDAGALCASIIANNDLMIQTLLRNRPITPFLGEVEVTAIGLAARKGKCDVLRSLLASSPVLTGPNTCQVERRKLWSHQMHPEKSSAKWINYGSRYVSNRSHDKYDIRSSPRARPLTIAAMGRSPQTVEACVILLQSGFQPDKLTWVELADHDNIGLAQALLDHNQKYRVDAQVALPNPLLRPIRSHNKVLVSLLSDAGVDVNEYDETLEYERSPLQAAAEEGDMDIVDRLIAAGANINAPPAINRGGTALQLAAIRGHLGLAKHLIELGAEVNALPARTGGRTALEGAAEHGRIDMLELLIRNGAETTGTWQQHYIRAVRLATDGGFHAAAELLKRSGNWSTDDQRELDVCTISDGEPLWSSHGEQWERCG